MNGIIVVDKPSGKTSHDVVNVIRRKASQRRVGHTGTLDPMATGVLVLMLGKATRLSRFLDLEPKVYIAEALFGITTDTQDITGTIIGEQPGPISSVSPFSTANFVDEDDIKRVLPNFIGDIEQIPPMVSAIKIGGQTLYKLARKGVEIERPSRQITIHELDLLDYKPSERFCLKDDSIIQGTGIKLRVKCSGGTYVRTLVHDIGQRLEVGATLASLQRTSVGRFSLESAVTLDALTDVQSIRDNLISMNDALYNLPMWIVKDDAIELLLNGRELNSNSFLADQANGEIIEDMPVRLTTREGALLAIGRIKKVSGSEESQFGIKIKPDVVLK
jgi:tRNA pseudouridine55 synthase